MSEVDTSPRIAVLALPGFRTSLSLVVIVIGSVAYALNAWRWGTIPDTSWLTTVVELVASGQRLYSDVIETNPPFSIWLYAIPVRLAAALGVAPEGVVRLYTLIICLAGSALTGWMLAASGLLARRRATTVAVALFAVAVLLSGNAFSQRDQLGAVLCLPLLVLAAWRALPEPKPSPEPLHWLAAGAGAGVLAMVKPYYAAVVFSAACLLALKRRDLRAFFMPEFLLSAALTAACLAVSNALHPEFFETLLPLLSDTYMSYRLPLGMLLQIVMPWLALPAAYLLVRRFIERPEPCDFLMLAAAAALLPYLLQGKGWAYHAYAAVLFGSAALVVSLAMLSGRRASGSGSAAGLGRVLLVVVAVMLAHLRFAASEKPDESLVMAGRQAGGNPTVGILGGGIEIGHPLARMIGGRWVEPYCSDWPATYAFRRQAAGDPAEAQRYEAMASAYFAGKRSRLLDDPPQILIVDRGDRLVAAMVGRFGFQPVLDLYDRIAAAGDVELYRLKPMPVASAGGAPVASH